jgi:hypothetical protein
LYIGSSLQKLWPKTIFRKKLQVPKKSFFGPYLVTFSLFWRRQENKENRLFYFGLLLPIQIQFLKIENPKNPKIDSTYSVVIYSSPNAVIIEETMTQS